MKDQHKKRNKPVHDKETAYFVSRREGPGINTSAADLIKKFRTSMNFQNLLPCSPGLENRDYGRGDPLR
jgi:hypothetical protein